MARRPGFARLPGFVQKWIWASSKAGLLSLLASITYKQKYSHKKEKKPYFVKKVKKS
jgi:hypothetical protein